VSGLIRTAAGSPVATVLAVIGLFLGAVLVGVAGFGLRVTGAAALYFVIWWIGLFAVLPFGIRSQAEAGEISAGSEPGAPAAPALREKAIWTSLLAAGVFVLTVSLLPLAGL